MGGTAFGRRANKVFAAQSGRYVTEAIRPLLRLRLLASDSLRAS